MVAVVVVAVMEEVDIAVVAVAVAEVSTILSIDPVPSLMGLTRTLVGGFTSSNAAPLGGNRRW